jgi:hypothetical protein
VYLKYFDCYTSLYCDEDLVNKLLKFLPLGVPASTMKTQETGSYHTFVTAYKGSQHRNQETTLYIDFDMLLYISANLLSSPKARTATERIGRQSSERKTSPKVRSDYRRVEIIT